MVRKLLSALLLAPVLAVGSMASAVGPSAALRYRNAQPGTVRAVTTARMPVYDEAMTRVPGEFNYGHAAVLKGDGKVVGVHVMFGNTDGAVSVREHAFGDVAVRFAAEKFGVPKSKIDTRIKVVRLTARGNPILSIQLGKGQGEAKFVAVTDGFGAVAKRLVKYAYDVK